MMLFLLQTKSGDIGFTMYQTSTNPEAMWIFGSVVMGVIIFMVIARQVNRKQANVDPDKRRYNRRIFRREAKKLHLTGEEIAFLEKSISQYNIRHPFALLSPSNTLKGVISASLRDIKYTPSGSKSVQAKKQMLYKIQEKVELGKRRGNPMTNTRKLPPGYKVSVRTAKGREKHDTTVVTNQPSYLAIAPVKSEGNRIYSWPRGTNVNLYVFSPSGEEVYFPVTVMGERRVQGVICHMLTHSARPQKSGSRQFKRKELNESCFFYPVRMEMEGRGAHRHKTAYVLKRQKRTGTILDISTGGCAVSAKKALKKGEHIRIDFSINQNQPLIAYGQVIDAKRDSKYNYLMRIRFTKTSTESLNRLFEFIYEWQNS